jgi:hypothetical protein
MSRLRHARSDYRIRLDETPSGSIRVRGGTHPAVEVSTSLMVGELFGALDAALEGIRDGRRSGGDIRRVVISTNREELDRVPWEQFLPDDIRKDFLCVRDSAVRAQIAATPLNLPLRLLEVDGDSVGAAVRHAFGDRGPEAYEDVVTVTSVSWSQFDKLFPGEALVTADVIHFHDTSFLPPGPDLLRTAAPDWRGTLGWFLRRLALWQTRLLILEGWWDYRLFELAAAIVARGGPAVRITDAMEPGIYDRLLHDAPLDRVFEPERSPWKALFLGGGREELLRVSQIGERIVSHFDGLSGSGRILPDPAVRSARDFATAWREKRFNLQARPGLLPMSNEVIRVRDTGFAVKRSATPSEQQQERSERYVNAMFFDEEEDPHVRRRQNRAPLLPGKVAHLGIDIGPRDEGAWMMGQLPILEDAFKWTPDMLGAWIEIAVTGIDCDVIGAPVRELWLPRQGASDRIYFAVTPREDRPIREAARLRYCIYHGSNLVQSWLLAALVEPVDDPSHDAHALARALGLEPDAPLGPREVGWVARLEYTTLTDLDRLDSLSPRSLSVFANDSLGERRLTLKGSDFFVVVHPQNLGAKVVAARQALEGVGLDRTPPDDPRHWTYRYEQSDRDKLKQDLQSLATAGWNLYQALIPNHERIQLRELLANRTGRLKFVHHDLRETIPWGLLYDRKIDTKRASNAAGVRLEADTCLAALPRSDGSFPTNECGGPDCLLNPQQIAARKRETGCVVDESTVACPLRFWGFRHEVEVPVAQTSSFDREAPEPEPTEIAASPKPVVAVGWCPEVPGAKQHVETLDTTLMPLASLNPKNNRDDVVQLLLDGNPIDVVYLFCHAHKPQPSMEQLVFGANAKGVAHVFAADLDPDGAIWCSRPLAFLNGCGTAAFDPESLSPFVETLIRDRGASVVIGTEVRVWSTFAAEVGLEFLSRFLTGDLSAGDCLLTVRRALLSRLNPLGLAYTLYGRTELVLMRLATC